MKPKILITCGDPNGIGPEIILKIFSNSNIRKDFDLKVIGIYKVFEHYSKKLKIKNLQKSDVLEIHGFYKLKINEGKIRSIAGRLSGEAVRIGSQLIINKEFDALVTMPINKLALNRGGFHYSGHTDMLAELTNSKNPVMIMYSEEIKVVPLTIHIPLNLVSDTIDIDLLYKQILIVKNTFRNLFKIKEPKIALLSLNPHNGDGGLLGREEIRI